MTREEYERIQQEHFKLERLVINSRDAMNKAKNEGNEEERKKYQREYKKSLEARRAFESTEEFQVYLNEFQEGLRDEILSKMV